MEKTAEAFRTISEVANWLELPTHVLRFWESQFSQIKPVKRAGGRRYYRPKDMLLIGGIKKLLHEDGAENKAARALYQKSGYTEQGMRKAYYRKMNGSREDALVLAKTLA